VVLRLTTDPSSPALNLGMNLASTFSSSPALNLEGPSPDSLMKQTSTIPGTYVDLIRMAPTLGKVFQKKLNLLT